MKLIEYLVEVGDARRLARDLCVSEVTVSQWRSGIKTPAPAMCVSIERATRSAVRRWDLRPDDWHRIWPELINAKGAPKVPEQAAAG